MRNYWLDRVATKNLLRRRIQDWQVCLYGRDTLSIIDIKPFTIKVKWEFNTPFHTVGAAILENGVVVWTETFVKGPIAMNANEFILMDFSKVTVNGFTVEYLLRK